MAGLCQLLLQFNAPTALVEDYAACLELRSEETQVIENVGDDQGVLILQVSPKFYKFLCFSKFLINLLYFANQLLIDNINHPAPNITHLLLKFDLDTPVERTVLQPKYHYRYDLVLSNVI